MRSPSKPTQHNTISEDTTLAEKDVATDTEIEIDVATDPEIHALKKKAAIKRLHATEAHEDAISQSKQCDEAELKAKNNERQAESLKAESDAAETKARERSTQQAKLKEELNNTELDLEHKESIVTSLQEQLQKLESEKRKVQKTQGSRGERGTIQLKVVTEKLSVITDNLKKAKQERDDAKKNLNAKGKQIAKAEKDSEDANNKAKEARHRVEQALLKAKQARSEADDLSISKTLATKKAMREEWEADHADLLVFRRETQREQEAFQRETRTNKTLTLLMLIVVGVFSLIFVYVLAFNQNILDDLSQANFARGLITFTIAVGTIIIALLLVLVALMGSQVDSTNRFANGKEILTILIGVLGTIVGFYYGATNGEGGAIESMTVSSPLPKRTTITPGAKTSLVYAVNGGIPPYEYVFECDHPNIEPIKGELNNDHQWITHQLLAPQSEKEFVTICSVNVKDSQGELEEYVSSFSVAAL